MATGATNNSNATLEQLQAMYANVMALANNNTGGGATAPAANAAPAATAATNPMPTPTLGGPRLFQQYDALRIQVQLDNRGGLATGLANLARLGAARQERVRLLSDALAYDANQTGAVNAVDIQKMAMETQTMEHMSSIAKKISDSMNNSIQAWLR